MKNEEKRTLMGTFRDYQRCKCAERRAKMEKVNVGDRVWYNKGGETVCGEVLEVDGLCIIVVEAFTGNKMVLSDDEFFFTSVELARSTREGYWDKVNTICGNMTSVEDIIKVLYKSNLRKENVDWETLEAARIMSKKLMGLEL